MRLTSPYAVYSQGDCECVVWRLAFANRGPARPHHQFAAGEHEFLGPDVGERLLLGLRHAQQRRFGPDWTLHVTAGAV